MKFTKIAAVSAAALALSAGTLPTLASASPAQDDQAPLAVSQSSNGSTREDNLSGPYSEKQSALRQEAGRMLRAGEAKANDKGVVKVDSKNFVETTTPKSDKILTILSEFGGAGPQHNQIPEPDRTQDNSTYWVKDFNLAHYNTLFNGSTNSMKDFYEKQSNGKYSVTNTVEDWVTVPQEGKAYGANDVESNGGAWNFIRDTGNAWYDKQIKSGKTPAQIDAYLSQFDVWDRYDFDGDGNFNESDGYIDHFQAVHSGGGEDGGAGDDAIWSHRWYAFGNDAGSTGPSNNLSGGTKIGQSKYWIGDYTTEPENGGLGVFAHEYGHDLGLPDYYDTTNKAENGTGYWTLMSAGSWLGRKEIAGNGDTPGSFGPEEKLFLGWLRGSNVPLGTTSTRTLSPSQFQVSGQEQAVRVDLPNKVERIEFSTPTQGHRAWWSGAADRLNGSVTADVAARQNLTVTATLWYNIEQDYDFLYPEYSLDGGKTWKIATNAQTGKAEPITGSSDDKWVTPTFTYAANGAPSKFRFRYQTDGAVTEVGVLLDDIKISSERGLVTANNAESDTVRRGFTKDPNWVANRGYLDKVSERYYLVENRQFKGYDAVLQSGPYNFGTPITKPDWVQYFSYTKGMLVWYVDHSYDDNNTSQHPGGGMALPVDARVAPIQTADGLKPLGGRRQSYDATFGLGQYDKLCLPRETPAGVVTPCAPAGAQNPEFNDTDINAYYNTAMPYHSVQVAGHGVKARVTGQNADGSMTVSFTNPAAK